MKPKKKVWGIVGICATAVLVGLTITADVLVGNYSSMINLYFRKDTLTKVNVTADEALQKAREFTEKEEGEGAVLLKNNGLLPLTTSSSSKKKINLFGNCSVQNLYQGSGSASSWFKQELNVDLKTGLENAGFEVNPGLIKFYNDNLQERNDQAGGQANMTGADASIFEEAMSVYDSYTYEGSNILDYSKEYSDTAFVVIARAGGEGADAKLDMNGITGGDAGKHYLELQQVEIDLVNYVTANYENVVILLNTAVPMELGFVEDDKIDAVLWMGMPGSTGFNAVGDIISGAVNPSGHTADTWTYKMEDVPSYYNFGDYTYSNFTDPLNQGREKYVYYVEGIYVGYRYFETAAAENYINYDDVVQYPFGYGLSYTTFSWSNAKWSVGGKGEKITVSVDVKNTGDVAGKDVVQLYYHAPYNKDEGIEKSEVVLGGFTKTKLLSPGETETVTITMDYDDMSSYDYAKEKAYVLSSGDYQLSLRSDSHTINNNLIHDFKINNKIVYNESNGKRSSDKVVATNQYDDVTVGDGTFNNTAKLVTRSDFKGTLPTSRDQYANAEANASTISRMGNSYAGSSLDIENLDKLYPGYEKPTMSADNGLVVSDMIGLDYDDPQWDKLLDELSLSEMEELFGNCGWHNPAIVSIQKGVGIDMDGAEGLHDLTSDKTGNQYTITVILASSWNAELAKEFGDVYGDECLVSGISALYAPSMNIHRNPFGGRAFEYYSEDPLLSGKMAAAQIKELWEEKKVSVYIKHYMLNDQETNRQKTVHTWATEQTIREIYARPFEISVKEGHATGFMAGYNAIGTTWTGASLATMTTLPRTEWGFTGRIVTDACDDYVTYSSDAAVVAGVDMWLTAMKAKVSDKITKSNYGLHCLRRAAHDQLYVFANSSATQMTVEYSSVWKVYVGLVNAALILGAAACVIFLVYPAFFIKKKVTE